MSSLKSVSTSVNTYVCPTVNRTEAVDRKAQKYVFSKGNEEKSQFERFSIERSLDSKRLKDIFGLRGQNSTNEEDI